MAALTLKLECPCGTRFKFEVEPVDGRMPVDVVCPHCGTDATEEANRQIEIALGKTAAPKIDVPKPYKAEVAKPVLKISGKRVPQHTVSLPPQVHRVGLAKRAGPPPKEPAFNTKWIVLGITALVIGVCALWIWYSFYGSKPSVAFSAEINHAERVEFCKFVGPDQVLLKTDRALTMYDSHGLKVLWTTSLAPYQTPMPDEDDEQSLIAAAKNLKNHVPPEVGNEFLGRMSSYVSSPIHEYGDAQVRIHGGEIWILFPDSLVVFDRKTGKEKKKVALHGQILQIAEGDSVIFATATGRLNEGQFTRVALRTGDVLTDKFSIPEAKKWTETTHTGIARDDSTALLGGMAGMMEAGMAAGTFQDGEFDVEPHQLHFIPAGVNVAHLEVDLIEKKVTSRQVVNPEDLKPKEELGASGPVKVTDAMALAKEMQYESMKAKGGEFERNDESRYKVTLKRHLEDGAPVWTGEVVGPPVFYPLKTVDVLLSNKSIQVFAKENEKLWESPLAFAPGTVAVAFGDGHPGPCFESGNTLYLYDSQALTSFELDSGKVRWRMPQPGVESVRLDGDGMLYITNSDSVCKVDPETGKMLWKLNQKGVEFFLSNKYVYLSKSQVSGADVIQSMGTGMEVPTHFRIFRVDPKTGQILWEFYRPKAPSVMDFQGNRILLLYTGQSVKDMQTHSGRRPIPSELQILKYLTF